MSEKAGMEIYSYMRLPILKYRQFIEVEMENNCCKRRKPFAFWRIRTERIVATKM